MIERCTVQFPTHSVSLCCNCCGTGRIVQKCQFTKRFPWFVRFKELGRLTDTEHFVTVKLAFFNNEQNCTSVALSDHILASPKIPLNHCAYNDVLLFLVESREHE